MLNKEERQDWKRLHRIFEHGETLAYGAGDVMRYDYLTRLLDFQDHDALCGKCFPDAL